MNFFRGAMPLGGQGGCVSMPKALNLGKKEHVTTCLGWRTSALNIAKTGRQRLTAPRATFKYPRRRLLLRRGIEGAAGQRRYH